jgi:hypothetical protein
MRARQLRWLDRDTVRGPHMALCLSEKAFLAAARHCKVSVAPGEWLCEGFEGCTHTWQDKHKLMCVVCIDPSHFTGNPIGIASLLVHEAVHAYQRLRDSIGETRPGIEFEAYAIQGIADRLMREFVRQTR